MRVLIVGAGGREHALAWRLVRDPSVTHLVAAPGNAGIAREAECVSVAAEDLAGLVSLAERARIDLTVIGPEGPLAAGLADELRARGRAVFGPSRSAARIEGSKAWAKDLCERYAIPAARSRAVRSVSEGMDALDGFGPPYVVKADGLAAGKGVVITADRRKAIRALERCLVEEVFGEAGSIVVVEEHLSGREVSAFALTDGSAVVPLGMAQDYKRAYDDDAGPNTGGMGAYSPVPSVDPDTAKRIDAEVLERTIGALAAEGTPFVGVLYAGLMLTEAGPRVLEFNGRFGDPETQVLMPRLLSEPAEVFLGCARGDVRAQDLVAGAAACVTVVLASAGYPGTYETGFEISGLEAASRVDDAIVFHSGTVEQEGRVVTAGGRVLSISGIGSSIAEARDRAYEATSRVSFEGMHQRTDIAALAAKEEGT